MSLIGVIDMAGESAAFYPPAEMRTGIANMRRFVKTRAKAFLVLGTPFMALRSASRPAETFAVSSAASMSNIAGVDLRAAVSIVFYNSKVALDLTLNGRGSFADITADLTDGMAFI